MSLKISQPKFVRTLKYFSRLKRLDPARMLHKYGKRGVEALQKATPVDTSNTANSWSYSLTGNKKRYVLSWSNSVMAGSTPLVILLHYGHATKSGYFLSGRNFINPAIKPIYDAIEEELMKEVFR